MEEKLVEIFGEVLAREQVGIRDNFFEIGGHSLKATIAVNQIEARTGCRLTLQEFLQGGTVENLAVLIEEKGTNDYQPIPKAEKKETYEATSAQKRIYLVHELEPEETAYNIPAVLKVGTRLDKEKVTGVFQKLQQRHEALRSRFVTEDGILMQYIEQEASFVIEYEETKSLDSQEIRKSVEKFIRPFSLDCAPLFRAKLVQSMEESILMIDLHHIIADGISMAILQKEFSDLYNGTGALADGGIDYHDYSEWMAKRDMNGQRKYWVDMYEDDIPALEMTEDYARGRTRNYEGEYFAGTINFKDAVETLARQNGVTEFVVMLGALMMTLGKYSRQEDIVVGSPVSGRFHHDTESLVGMFVNTLAFRGRPEKQKTVASFLKELGQTCVEGLERQEYPLEELVEEVCTNRDLARSPLFDVMFALEEEEQEKLRLGGSEAVPIKLEHCMAKFDLTLNVQKQAEDYQVELVYSSGLYKKSSIQSMLSCYIEVLKEMCQKPEQRIGELSGLAVDMKEKILNEFNDTKTELGQKETVIEIFEEQVGKTPDSIAVEYRDKSITYKELNAKANGLGRKLRNLGVGCDDFVGIIAERSLEMIEGIYGILKSGGAYVPIDPVYPSERTAYILKDCSAKAVLVYVEERERRQKAVEAATEAGVPVILLSDQEMEKEIENLEKINGGESLVYCIYTSGTTGKPKGVMNCQKGLRNRVLWMDSRYPMGEGDRILQKTTYTFDVSVWEIVWWALKGASVVMLENGDEKDPQKICEVIAKRKVTVLHFVPSMLEVFEAFLKTSSLARRQIKSLRYIFASGEALKMIHVNTFNSLMVETHGQTRLINVYGPTEASIDVTYYDCQKEQDIIPIGKPISNIQMYVLDGEHLCGIGMPGELCIGGVGLARGYLNRPDLTSEKFIDNPFGEGRLYRTGDLGRWLEDGNIEYLGRMDEQTKIRGFRIELQEVESVIREVEGVQDAVVIAKEDSNQEKSLYAYVVGDVELADVKDSIRKKLPDYMMPSYMQKISEIPVTKSGKLDKRALPDIKQMVKRDYQEPETHLEKQLASIFERILSVNQIGRNDTFMELGGDSIKAARLIMEIRKEFKVQIPFSMVFDNLNVQALSKEIENMMANQKEEYVSGHIFVGGEQYESISEVQEYSDAYRSVFQEVESYKEMAPIQIASYYMNIRKTSMEINFYEELDQRKVNEVWNGLLKSDEILCSAIDMSTQKIVKYHKPSCVTVPFFDLSELEDKEKGDILYSILKCNKIYDEDETYNGKVVLTVPYLLRISEKHYKLSIVCSHLIMDGFAKDVFTKKFIDLYRNNIERIKTYSGTYDEYVNMMRGIEHINIQQFYEKMALKRFVQAIDTIKNESVELQKFTFSYPVLDWNRDIEQKLMEAGIQILNAISRLNYDSMTEVPFFIVIHGRQYKNKSFSDVIGECMDVLPMTMESDGDIAAILQRIDSKMQYLKENNINFIGSYFENKNLPHDLEMKYLLEKDSLYKIPFYNYLALYDADKESKIPMMKEFEGEEKININLVYKKDESIEVSFYIRKDKWKKAEEAIVSIMDSYLNE